MRTSPKALLRRARQGGRYGDFPQRDEPVRLADTKTAPSRGRGQEAGIFFLSPGGRRPAMRCYVCDGEASPVQSGICKCKTLWLHVACQQKLLDSVSKDGVCTVCRSRYTNVRSCRADACARAATRILLHACFVALHLGLVASFPRCDEASLRSVQLCLLRTDAASPHSEPLDAACTEPAAWIRGVRAVRAAVFAASLGMGLASHAIAHRLVSLPAPRLRCFSVVAAGTPAPGSASARGSGAGTWEWPGRSR